MTKLWLTYAWVDNGELQVDYLAQELRGVGLDVRYDRIHIVPGQRLWPQIDAGIAGCDAWAIVVSKKSLESEPCREELGYALDKALSARDDNFPIIGIFVEQIDRTLIPSAIRTRLYTNIKDPNWKEIVRAGVDRSAPAPPTETIQPYILSFYEAVPHVVFECRPRAGRWTPCIIGVPKAEKDLLQSSIIGPNGRLPMGGGAMNVGDGEFDGFFIHVHFGEVTPSHSVFATLSAPPSELIFGSEEKIWRLSEESLQRIRAMFR